MCIRDRVYRQRKHRDDGAALAPALRHPPNVPWAGRLRRDEKGHKTKKEEEATAADVRMEETGECLAANSQTSTRVDHAARLRGGRPAEGDGADAAVADRGEVGEGHRGDARGGARRDAATAGEDARDRRADADNRSRRVRARFLPLAGREAVPTPEIRRGARRATRDAEPNPKLRFFASAGRRPNGTDGDVGRDAGTDGDGGRTIFCFPNRALLACASLKGPPGGRGSVDGARKNSSPRTSRGWRPRFSVLYVCISSLKMSGSYAFNCASSTYW